MGTAATENTKSTAASDDAAKQTPPADDGGKQATAPASDATQQMPENSPPASTKKPEKTFTAAERDAAATKAVEEARKKWEEEKDLTEFERLKKENADLIAGNRMRDARDEVTNALEAAGAKSPALAFEALRSNLKFDEAGKLVNSKDLIDGLKTAYPEQFGIEKPKDGIDAGAGGDGKTTTKLTRAQLEKMTPQEVAKLDWKEVSAALTANEAK